MNIAGWLPLSGLVCGVVLGFVARRNFFCTLSALESYWYGENSTGLRTWVLAAVVAAAATQVTIATGLSNVSEAIYLQPRFTWVSAILGGLAFGFGMALVGTCGFGALVRLGGGSLKSLVAVIVLGFFAMATERGLLGIARIEWFDRHVIDFSAAGSQSIPDLAGVALGEWSRLPIILALIGIPTAWIFKDANYRSQLGQWTTGIIVGLVIALGWLITSMTAAHSFEPVAVESVSFVAPIADALLHLSLFTGSTIGFGVAVVPGVVIGAAIAANRSDNVRWEACDDARELSRHLVGAALMGFGGILALGCTIGQGVAAASLLTVSAPIVLLSIAFGSRLGLAWLLEGTFRSAFYR